MESESIEIAGRKVTKADWDATPESVKLVIEDFHGMIGVLTLRVSNLEEKLNKNSKNSSIPPSKNGFGGGKKAEQKKVKRATKQRIKQETSEPKLYPASECQEIHEEKPQACTECGEKLQGEDSEPYRHQIIEMPIVRPDVVEYRLHELECEHCGTKTRAELPAGVTPKSYGQGLAAWIAILSSEYRQSYRQVCWAHLLRDFQAMAERSGASSEIGASLLHKGHRLFHWWHRVRDGTMSRGLFIEATNLIRAAVKAELESAVNLPISRTETTPLAKTVRTCEQLLKIEPALWTFVDHQDLEPTNNLAERALRPAVIGCSQKQLLGLCRHASASA